MEPPTPRLQSQPLWAEAQRAGGAGPRGRSPLTPVRELLVVAVFPLVGQWVQVVATTTFPNHVLLKAGADTGLGVGGKGQREGRLEGDVPTSAPGARGPGSWMPRPGGLGEPRRCPSRGEGW